MFRATLGWIRQARIHSVSIIACVAIILGFGFFYRLGSSTSGLSQAELNYKNSALSLRSIYHNPINAPHKLLEYGLSHIGSNSWFMLRLTSVLFAIIFILSFYIIAKNWFGRTIGLLSSLLFFSLPIFIIAARQASAEIMFFCPLALMARYYWLTRSGGDKTLPWLILIITCALAIYVPGVVWLLIGAVIINRTKLSAVISQLPNWLVSLGVAIFIVMLVPAALAIFHDWRLVRDFALIPAHWPLPLQLLKNLGWMLSALVVKTPYYSALIIGRLPILDIIQIALLVFGVYAMWVAAKAKALTLALFIAFSVVVAAINNNVSLLILGLPAIGIFMAAGLRYLYIEWRSVFPTNPIPRTLAMVLITALVIAQLAFGLSYAVVAWPHSLATKSAYVLE